jgi:hypothetical protein
LITSTLGFGLIYMLGLFGNALTAYFNRLWGRFQLPFYFPLMVLFLTVIGLGLRNLRQGNSRAYHPLAVTGSVFLAVLSALQFGVTIGLMWNAHSGVIPENWINTREVNENSILQYWKNNPPAGEFRLFSNYNEMVAFQTQHETLASPRRSGETFNSIESYRASLFSDDGDVYLIWIEPNTYDYVYLPSEYGPVAKLEVILENRDGGIYRLHPVR